MNTRVTLLRLTDQCVKCGYCLPSCPTFALRQHEAESPRGRVALIQGWLTGALPSSPAWQAHLEHCLLCRACERVCPSQVKMGQLLDGARAFHVAQQPRWQSWWQQLPLLALSHESQLQLLARLARLYRLIKRWQPAATSRWAVLAQLSRQSAPVNQPVTPPRQPATTSAPAAPPVAIFRGCVAPTTEPVTLAALQQVLDQLGIAYTMPRGQGCCGALLRHHGHVAAAERVLAPTVAALQSAPLIIGTASACVAELRQYGQLNAVECCRWLADHPALAAASIQPLAARVLVHEPCSQRNWLGDPTAAYQLLRHIPRLDVQPLPDNTHCCGAAGTQLLIEPAIAAAMAANKIAAIHRLQPDYVVTTNTGCALHLQTQLHAAGLTVPVVHPVVLLARQLTRDGE